MGVSKSALGRHRIAIASFALATFSGWVTTASAETCSTDLSDSEAQAVYERHSARPIAIPGMMYKLVVRTGNATVENAADGTGPRDLLAAFAAAHLGLVQLYFYDLDTKPIAVSDPIATQIPKGSMFVKIFADKAAREKSDAIKPEGSDPTRVYLEGSKIVSDSVVLNELKTYGPDRFRLVKMVGKRVLPDEGGGDLAQLIWDANQTQGWSDPWPQPVPPGNRMKIVTLLVLDDFKCTWRVYTSDTAGIDGYFETNNVVRAMGRLQYGRLFEP